MESKIIDLLQQKVIEQFALNNPIYGGSTPVERTVMDDYLLGTIQDVNKYISWINAYTKISKDPVLNEEDKRNCEASVETIRNLIIERFLDDNSHRKERYEKTKNAYGNTIYFEYPLSVMGINDNEHSVFGTCFFDLCALKNNKKYAFGKIMHEPILLKKLYSIYKPYYESEKDLYFDYFKNLDRFEDRLVLVKKHFEFSHIAIGNIEYKYDEPSYALFGSFANIDQIDVLTKDPDSVLEKLKITL